MLCKIDENSFVPKVIQNNVVLPAKVFAQTSINALRQPVGNILSSVQNEFTNELAKSESEYLYTLYNIYNYIKYSPIVISLIV